ncbi:MULTISPECIES: WXG100 family type VII secretion target [Microbacterium]|jgi:WXG100 family type VII secretion target|uniref:ESAT-6-like protein n=2 Tax=Microbacterium TaxID=33882 RepID=A0A5J5JDU5_9MICO|nr:MULTISPECIES: WXG100 family type VII secretion target [Microbacterium]KAA9149590.1 WXG100 family type VII secretion target [Microbacterium lushaniae]KAA9150915.1 WXG100 family type VII secretion target [Microbacterium lushaniae]MCK6066608.1 WXG100 family type VII secretion target [Microbacterium sp. EYE_512]QBR87942.1 WXG100 family type VII secretion target [Microbacterium wangchenii]QEW02326.1 WXG100 family type VII secretion target [Microbacterium lushaniae]
MADIKVTSESLSGVANQLSSGAASIESQLSNLKSLVQGLIAGDWGGAASQSFNELYEQWDAAGLQLKESLTGISDQLSKAALAYEESENNISNSFRA